MNYWLLADTHFGHDKMKEYCGRPDNFEQKILKQVASHVKPEDILIHLGDICIYRDEHWHERLVNNCYGRMWLIRGNHDRKSLGWYLSHGWDCVCDTMTLKVFGRRILFSHRPAEDNGTFDLNIHGHLHNTRHHPECLTGDKHRLICMEDSGYLPVNLRRVVNN